MFSASQSTKAVVVGFTMVLSLAGMTDLANGQQRFRAVRRSPDATTVTNLDNATRFNRELVRVPVKGRSLVRPKLLKGDPDFAGNGPEVWLRVQFLVNNNSVYRRTFMQAVETHSTLGATFGDNITTISGWSAMEKVWTPPAGQTIVKLMGVSEKTNLVHEVFKGHGPHVRQTAVGRMTIYADQKGGDQNYTRTMVDFDYELPVMVQNSVSNFVKVHLPRTVDYRPPLVNGDGDFKGHGPWVTVTVYLTHSPRQVNFVLFMKARETQPDFTTTAGYYTKVIYKAPPGKRINAVLGKTKWENVVNYVDDDHEIDRFRDPELGPIQVWGDRRGKEIQSSVLKFVRVLFSDIQREVLVRLEDE